MANLVGTGGNFAAVGFTNGKIQSWTGTIDGSYLDTTGFGDLGWGTGENVTSRMSGSAIAILNDSALPGVAGIFTTTSGMTSYNCAFTLTMGEGKTFTFTGTMASITVMRSETGSSTISFNFISSGQVTQTWA